MQLFIDSYDTEEIEQAKQWGIIEGVTTNPTLISKSGKDKKQALSDVLEASPGPVFCQVCGWYNTQEMVDQAKWLHAYSKKIIVKLPISVEGIKALSILKKESRDIQIAITAVASVSQAYLCGKLGADVVALFNGPLGQSIDQDVRIVGYVKKIYQNYGFTTKVLSCGRYPNTFIEFAVEGSDMCTMKFEFLKLLYEHPFTEKRMTGFLQDWQTAFGNSQWGSE